MKTNEKYWDLHGQGVTESDVSDFINTDVMTKQHFYKAMKEAQIEAIEMVVEMVKEKHDWDYMIHISRSELITDIEQVISDLK